MLMKNYAYWSIDTFIPYVDVNDSREAVALADREVETNWIRKEQNINTKKASIASVDDYGFQDRWYQNSHYEADYKVSSEYMPYVADIPFDTWVVLETPTPVNKRWLKEAVETNKWAQRPYDETLKIWKEY